MSLAKFFVFTKNFYFVEVLVYSEIKIARNMLSTCGREKTATATIATAVLYQFSVFCQFYEINRELELAPTAICVFSGMFFLVTLDSVNLIVDVTIISR